MAMGPGFCAELVLLRWPGAVSGDEQRGWYTVLVAAVAVERWSSWWSRPGTCAGPGPAAASRAGAGHYPFMAAVHTLLLVVVRRRGATSPTGRSCPALGWPMLALVVGTQGLRWWCVRTLGPQWNTRIVVVPGLPLVAGGPYRMLRHPNYVAVVLEVAALPLVHTAWVTAIVFSVLDAVVLSIRIPAEQRALARRLGDEPERYDVLVAGAGPVGLACAIEAAQRGLSVAVVDPRTGPIDKACGEGLMPGAVAALRPARRAARAGCRSAGSPTSTPKALPGMPFGPGRGSACGVRRCSAALSARAAELGVGRVEARVDEVESGRRLGPGRRPDRRVAAGLRRAALDRPAAARARPAAPAGRPSPVRAAPARRASRPWSDYVEVHWSPLRRGLRHAGRRRTWSGSPCSSAPARRTTSCSPRCRRCATGCAGAAWVTPVRGAGPLRQRGPRRVAGRVLLVGDAAGYVDALTGEGIRTGLACARAAVRRSLPAIPRRTSGTGGG